ncbi:MAG TPA: thioredoxin domain-containing protein [Patescibacteria group bacterium]|nr:thioredoxin domain-containing protein [Patescibacteria group bacterium]
MFCFLALIVFAIMGIFSASNRELAKEALACVFTRVTFRPCRTNFKDKTKAMLLGKLVTRSAVVAKFVNKNFELLSWAFFILSVVSTIWVAKGVYDYYLYGNCNGLNSSGFCVFDPKGLNSSVSSLNEKCYVKPPTEANVTLKNSNFSSFPVKNPQAKKKIIFIGCYLCDYTRAAYPQIKQLLKQNPDVSFTFAHFPVKAGSSYLSNYDYCTYKEDPKKFWNFNDLLFSSSKADLYDNPSYADKEAVKAGYNLDQLHACINSAATKTAVEAQQNEIIKTGIYGTPTIFIDGTPYIGPKPYRVYEHGLKPWFLF